MKEHNNILPLQRCALTTLCLALCFVATSAMAQKGKIIKYVFNPEAAKKAAETAIKTSSFKFSPIATDFTNASGLRLNPQGARHSITPSANTILGSDKVIRPGLHIHTNPGTSYISASERIKWREVRELHATLAYVSPTPPEHLASYLRHSVPPQTFQLLQEQYASVLKQIQAAKEITMPYIVYSSLPGEGSRIQPIRIGEINEKVYPLINSLRHLRVALDDDPFLMRQEEVWTKTFAVFNPLLAGVITDPGKEINRKDGRQLNTREFNLYNPDGTDYLLPRSETLLVDPDEMDEMESYAAVREKMCNPPIKPEAAEAERTALLNQLPQNMRIALINDDMLPRVNFQAWAQKGYLGHNATIETFPDGNGFMDKVRHGVKYDLVITDLLVPYGGIAMMPELRALDTSMPVIASSKFDRGEEDEEKLFELGFDGYLWYNTNLNEGAYGYIEYLRAMKNYFHYKQKYNWQR